MRIKTNSLNTEIINSHYKISTENFIDIALLLFTLQLPSLVSIFKYIHLDMVFFVPCYMVFMSAFYYHLFSKSTHPSLIRTLLNSPITMFFLLTSFFVIVLILYPHELALQAIGRGTDSGPALITSGLNLLQGNFPYPH